MLIPMSTGLVNVKGGEPWDLSSSVYVDNYGPASLTKESYGFRFSDDGSKFFFSNNTDKTIDEYSLSTAWDVSTGSFSQSLSVSGRDSFITGVHFKSDGTKMFFLGRGNDRAYEYSLSTAWDISTASFTRDISVSSQDRSPYGLAFSSDGTKMFVLGNNGDDVNEYTLSTAWSLSSVSFVDSFSVNAQQTIPTGLAFGNGGLKMYVLGISNSNINEYSLSTAWDVSTASFTHLIDVSAQNATPRCLDFKPDGTKMYFFGSTGTRSIYEYNLG